jgi:hypothetical protein
MQATRPDAPPPADLLTREHAALLHGYAQAQTRCSTLLHAQHQRIEALEAALMRSRAAVIVRDSALAWERAERQELERAIPGLPRRFELARRVEALLARLQDLIRHQQRIPASPASTPARPADPRLASSATLQRLAVPADSVALEGALEDSLATADLVICQTGCVSHGAYWRVEDHCRRTGKTCVLVDQPEALSIVRLHAQADHDTADLFKP